MVIYMENDNKEVGRRILRVVKEKNVSQAKFAKTINLSSSHVSNIINATSPATDRILSDIACKYNVSFNWLKTGEGDMHNVEKEIQNIHAMDVFNNLNEINRNIILKIADLLLKDQDNE